MSQEKVSVGAQKRIPIGEEAFHVTARVATQLGRQSISNSITAIIELVKNAYDADANTVVIRFTNLHSDNPQLTIVDDGYGMTLEQFRKRWFVIGTLNKLERDTSPKGRILTGEKGLGRLGLDRLAQETVVHSFTEQEQNGVELLIDWTKYESRADAPLEKINHQLFHISKEEFAPVLLEGERITKGTAIVLRGLKDRWNYDNLKELHKELSLLVSPFAGINDFSIYIDTGLNLPELDGEVGSDYLLEAAEWYITSEIDERGKVSYNMTSEQYDQTYTEKPRPWKQVFPSLELDYPSCGPVRFKLYFYPRRGVSTSELTFKRGEIVSFLNSNQGIRIYRDDFRVKPYGQPDGTGDWLNLSYRRQQSPGGVVQAPMGEWRVGYNQVVGAVFISRETNPNLIDQTNRESIVEGPAFFDLRRFGLWTVEQFERRRQEFEKSQYEPNEYEQVKEKASQSTAETSTAVEELKQVTKSLRGTIKPTDSVSKATLKQLESLVEDVERKVVIAREDQQRLTEVAEEEQAELQYEKDTLANLASLGILAATFGHETHSSANLMVATAQNLKEGMERGLFMVLPDVRADITNDLRILQHHARKVENFAKFTLQNLRRDKRRRVNIYLNDVVSQVFNFFRESLERRNIMVQLDLPNMMRPIKAFEIDWESILVNFITNSIWALQPIPANQRVIRVVVREKGKKVILDFADSGIGITGVDPETIFLPTVSTKRNSRGDVIGTGMGLTIVKGLVETYRGGRITVEPRCDLGGAQFRVEVQGSTTVSAE